MSIAIELGDVAVVSAIFMILEKLPGDLLDEKPKEASFIQEPLSLCRASDIFQDWWARMTHGAKYGGSFSEMTDPII